MLPDILTKRLQEADFTHTDTNEWTYWAPNKKLPDIVVTGELQDITITIKNQSEDSVIKFNLKTNEKHEAAFVMESIHFIQRTMF